MKNFFVSLLFILPILLNGQAPLINSISPQHGEIGTIVTITGTNFDITPENNSVFFGGIKANVLSATDEELMVEVPVGATYHSIVVQVDKYTTQSTQSFAVTFESDDTITASNSFDDGLNFTPGALPLAAIQVDLDGDGLLDLVSANEEGKNYSVFRNTSTSPGDISFSADLGSSVLGLTPKDIDYADFNGDGKFDIVLGLAGFFGSSNTIGVLKNTSSLGSVSFASPLSYNADSDPISIAVGDLDRDGKTDVVVVDGDNSQVSIFENTTNFNADVIDFDTHVDFNVGANPVSVAVADIDGDGLLDIITANSDDNSVSILRNTSTTATWSFDSKVDVSVDSSTPVFKVLVGDLDGDGLPEVLTKNEQQLTILRNTSTEANISFATAQNITFDTGFGFPGLGDLNGDSKLDIIVPGLGNDLVILTNTSNTGTISFTTAISLSYGADLGFNPYHVSTADMDNDGEPEIIVPGEVGGFIGSLTPELQVIRNLGSGTTFHEFSLPSQTSSTTIDDENHTIYLTVDGVDITSIIATFTISNGAVSDIGGIAQESAVTVNDFTNPVTYTITAEDGTTQEWTITAIVECPGDVINETVVTCDSYDFDGQLISSSGIYSRAYTNRFGCDSTVTVDLTIHPLAFYENVYAVASYDFDGATLTSSGQYAYGPFTSTETGCDSTFYLNLTLEPDTYDPQEYLQFQVEDSTFPVIETLGASHVEDVNGDGAKDVFFIGNTADGQIASLFINDGDGTFTEKTDHGIVGARVANRSSMFLDANGDNVLDFLVIGRTGGTNFTKLYLNDGLGNFAEKTDHGLPDLGSYSITTYLDSADVDGDDDLDLVISIFGITNSDYHEPQLWMNNGDGSYFQSTANDFPTTHSSLADFSDLDGDGDQDLLLRGSGIANRLWLNNGAGLFTEKLDQSLATLSPWGMVIFDVDDDGDLDIYDANTEAFSNQYTAIYFNNGDGSFTYDLSSDIPRLDANVGEAGTLSRAADFDNDGDLDLIMEGRYRYPGGPPEADYLEVWLNNGFGHFSSLMSRTLSRVFPADPFEFGRTLGYGNYQINKTLSVHDFDGDGRMDILLSGIDYVETLGRVTKLFYNKALSSELVVETCDSYSFDGSVLNTSGTYQGLYTDVSGTSYPVTLDLTILEPTSGDDDVEACDSYEWEGTVYTASGTYQEILTNSVGCDSTATLNLTILEPTSGVEDVEACESYEWEGTVYTTSGTYQEILTNSVGCDSTATLNLTILEPTSGDENVEACESYEWEGTVYTASGTYQEILTNALGCDSTATLNLTILEPTSGNDAVEACESYEWEGTLYTASGTYQQILTNSVGCDSTATLNLTILEPTSGDDDVEACDSYEWEGTVYTASGTYQEILTNSVGCDSTATLNLTILESTSGDDNVEACESYEWEGTVYTSSGTYQEILTNSVGCDSTATLNLTILEPTSGDDAVEACESYVWAGTVYTASGTYQEILTNSVGCDSTATLNLTILESTSGDDNVEACESYEWEGTVYTSSGTYQEILTNSVGCDSTATLNLTILEPTSGDDAVEACESYVWAGTVYTASGTYQEILTNSVGCDSTATLNLTILEPTTGGEDVEACGSYEWEGTVYTSSGTYQEILTNSVGCDSTATLNLTILESTSGDDSIEACESFEWEGTVYTSSGTYQEILTNAVGCDSTATLNLTILEPTSGDDDVEACESYEWEGTVYTASGTYQEILTNSVGCDSTATLNLTILEPTVGDEYVEACESYEWEGTVYTASGTYQEILTNSVGCDSTATLNLTINQPGFSEQVVETCGSYEWNGVTYTSSGTYSELFTNTSDCDSIATLELTLFEAYDITEVISACEGYSFGGEMYSTSGVYTSFFSSVKGCDSLVTLDLTINEPYFTETSADACGSYILGDQVITESGVYLESFLSQAGCDSVVSLTVGMLEEPDDGITLNGKVLFAEDDRDGLSYQWIDCETGEPMEGEGQRQLTPPRAGKYAVEITNSVCSVTSVCYEVQEENLVLNSAITTDLQVYPNPSDGPVHLNWENPQTSKISVIGLDGRVVAEEWHQNAEQVTLTINTPGLYVIRVQDSTTGGFQDHKVRIR